MKEKIYYFEGELADNIIITLTDDEFHHLSNVMRSKVHDKIFLFNGNGYFYHGEIVEMSKKYAKILIISSEQSVAEPKIQLDVYQALVKGDKLSLITQKLTELGASNLFLFESAFCDVKSNTGKQNRLKQISISAAKQCGRATVVESDYDILSVKKVTEKIGEYDAFFVAYENADKITLTDELLNFSGDLKKIAVMIGSEGGFSEKEIELLKESGAKIVSLGERILRTETASITCSAVITQILKC